MESPFACKNRIAEGSPSWCNGPGMVNGRNIRKPKPFPPEFRQRLIDTALADPEFRDALPQVLLEGIQ